MTVTTEYRVVGMHCDHCVHAVTEEVSAIPGVTDVRVDLASGELVVTSDTDLFRADVESAVDEAGYSLVAS
jgi:copper chaperone